MGKGFYKNQNDVKIILLSQVLELIRVVPLSGCMNIIVKNTLKKITL